MDNQQDGRSPADAGSGHSAEPEPASAVSSADAASTPNAVTFAGGFYVFRKKRGLKWKIGGFRMPWYQHATLDSATTEAGRLVTLFPDSTFVIMQAVATVKMEPAPAEAGAHKGIVI